MRKILASGALACVALLCGAAGPKHGGQDPVARSTSHYSDGTGDNMIDRLNAAQLPGQYTGPYYNRATEAPPPFQPVQLNGTAAPQERSPAPYAVAPPLKTPRPVSGAQKALPPPVPNTN